MKIPQILMITVSVFFRLFVTSPAYAPCAIINEIQECAGPQQLLDSVKTDKLNYENMEKPVITITGIPYTPIHIEIYDTVGNMMFSHDLGNLSNGTMNYNLDIISYKPGMYSIIVTSPSSRLTTSFTIGLAPIGGSIVLNTDRNSYLLGDNVTIVGTWNPHTLIQLSLIDPNGVSVKSMQIFPDKTGHFSSFDFSIPHIATSGTWKIYGTSGVNHASVNITVENIPGTQIDKTIIPSPLKQFQSGSSMDNIVCKEGLYLVVKSHDQDPMCLKAGTISKLASKCKVCLCAS